MNNFTRTKISDKNNVLIPERKFIETEKQIGNYNHISNTIAHSNYSIDNIEKYPHFIASFKTILNDVELLNKEEIANFIFENIGLLELLKTTIQLIKEHFPNYSHVLEFNRDPEIPNFNQIVLYVKGNENFFDEEWEEIKKINKKIRKIPISDKSVKHLFSVDLW